MSSVYVVQIDPSASSKLRAVLEEQQFSFTTPPYTNFQAKKNALTCTLYTSGKLVIQGKGMDEFIKFTLEPEVLGQFTYGVIDETSRVGVDESGKGDYFGPLCIAAVYAEQGSVRHLQELGVKDSKKLTDFNALSLAKKIEKAYPHSIVRIDPKRYNSLYQQFGNLNTLLGWGHATAIDELLTRVSCTRVLIDQFASEHVVEQALLRKKRIVDLVQRTRGEEDLVVAAASILARAAFLQGLEKLSTFAGLSLPKGAGKAIFTIGRRLISLKGRDILNEVAKLHFKTTEEILNTP